MGFEPILRVLQFLTAPISATEQLIDLRLPRREVFLKNKPEFRRAGFFANPAIGSPRFASVFNQTTTRFQPKAYDQSTTENRAWLCYNRGDLHGLTPD
jgi:hypothetical protein